MTEFIIKSDLPMPKSRAEYKRLQIKNTLDKMKVGEYFFFSAEGNRNSLNAQLSKYNKKHNTEFSVRKVEGGWNVWRLA